MEASTFLFVINPKAGGRGKHDLDLLIQQKAIAYQLNAEVVYTTHAGHAYELASHINESKYKAVIAVGGDGTINEVGRGLINKSVALGIIPIGSGNGLARFSKIPLKTIKAIENVFVGKLMGMDVIKIGTHFSFNVSGVGFDAAVAHDFQYLNKRGFWGYFKLVLKQAFNFKPVEISVDLHSAEGIKNINEKVFLMAIANSNQFGNNAIIAPTADTSDGKFNIVIVKPFPWFKMPYYAVMMFANQFDKIKAVLNFESTYCTIRASTATWHVDGEPVNMASPIEIKILPLAIKIIVPQEPLL
jgi:YegS/Rv2252/BmrU family lipid kinase